MEQDSGDGTDPYPRDGTATPPGLNYEHQLLRSHASQRVRAAIIVGANQDINKFPEQYSLATTGPSVNADRCTEGCHGRLELHPATSSQQPQIAHLIKVNKLLQHIRRQPISPTI